MRAFFNDKRDVFVLFLSVLLHFLFGAGLFVFRYDAIEPHQEITILYQEQEKPLAGYDKQKRGRKSQAREIPLAALIPKMSFKFQLPGDWTKDDQIEQKHASWTDSRAYDGVGSSTSGNLSQEQVRFFASLWRMIDQNIEENPFLSEYNQTGHVFLRFEVGENGQLVAGSLRAKAENRVLKVIAARAVRKAILNKTGDVQLLTQRTTVQAQFIWANYQICQGRRSYSGNFLRFCHYAENKRKTFSRSEKTATWVGAIVNNGPWAYEEIQKYNREESRRKSQFEPFKKYELDPDWNL